MGKEKKEIGKLLEFIKQFRIETQGDKELKKVERGETVFLFRYQPYVGGELQKGMTLFEETLISKSFGFIKWLVENDKIDKDNEELISLMSELGEFEQYEKCLLMLLSIQDEPIRFLCEILK